jgi:hypothetical protein
LIFPEFAMRKIALFTAVLAAGTVLAAPAMAQRHGGWGGGMSGGWGPYDRSDSWRSNRPAGPAEGKVEVTRFMAEDITPDTLAKGTISVGGAPTGSGIDDRELKTFEAAVEDQLATVGYQTAIQAGEGAQIAELRVTHDTVVPEEAPHKPVSGEMEVGVSNRGSMMGMALNIDMSKPRKALISTRLEARIRDKASGKVLWEGRADIITREGSDKWSDTAIASKLSAALFSGFPGKSGETRTAIR